MREKKKKVRKQAKGPDDLTEEEQIAARYLNLPEEQNLDDSIYTYYTEKTDAGAEGAVNDARNPD